MRRARPSAIRLERLLGTPLRDEGGQVIGLIEEFRAEREGGHCTITAYVLGPQGLLERLSATEPWRLIRGKLGLKIKPPRVVPSERVDLSDPERPRLRTVIV